MPKAMNNTNGGIANQSNWMGRLFGNVFLIDDKKGIEKTKEYVEAILATQDEDGYIGGQITSQPVSAGLSTIGFLKTRVT